MDPILTLVIYSIHISIFLCLALPRLLTVRQNICRTRIEIIGIHFLSLFVLFVFSSLNPGFTSFWLVGFIFFACLIPFRGSFFLKLFVVFILYFIFGSCEAVSCFSLILLNRLFPHLDLAAYFLLQNSTPRTFLVFMLSFAFLLFLLYRFFIPVLQSYLTLFNTRTAILLAFPITLLILMANLFFSFNGYLETYILLMCIFSLLFICCCISFLRGLFSLKKLNEQRLQNEIIQKQLELQISHSQVLNQEYINIRKWNHEISNHLISISYLIEREDYSTADQYIDHLLQQYQNEEKSI